MSRYIKSVFIFSSILLFVLGFFIFNVNSFAPPPPQSFYTFEEQFTETRSAKEKFSDIWKMVTTNGAELPPYPSLFNFLRDLNFLPLFSGQNLGLIKSTSMFRPWRTDHKLLHTQPTHASVKLTFNAEAHSHYTGLFESDSVDYGIMSYSAGFKIPNLTNFFAVSIRSFRDNVPASAIIAAFNVVTVPNWNVFDYMICTHYNWIMAIPVILLGPTRVGQGWTRFFNQFGLSNLAEYKENGEKVANPKFPWALCFIPNEVLRKKFVNHSTADSAYELVKGVEAGDKLYDIWAIKEPYPLAAPESLKRYSHLIGELITTSKFITSTYAAQRLLGTHQPFENDLALRPDWIPFASPFYLSRSGAVGVYSGLFPNPNPDIERAQFNLLLLMTGMLKAFTTVSGFKKFLVDFGITPVQLYQSTVGYITQVFIPMRLNPSTRATLTPPLKISAQWAARTIRNIALYVLRVGLHPPLGPLQLAHLGNHRADHSNDAIKLVEMISQTEGRGGNNHCIDHSGMETLSAIESHLSNDTDIPLSDLNTIRNENPLIDWSNKGMTTFNLLNYSNHVDNAENLTASLCMNQSSVTAGVNRPGSDSLLTVEDTLFKNVRLLPFHIDMFNSL